MNKITIYDNCIKMLSEEIDAMIITRTGTVGEFCTNIKCLTDLIKLRYTEL